MKKSIRGVSVFYSFIAVCSLLVAMPGQAQIIGSGYPPPGGVTNSGSGSAGLAGGKTSYYTNLDPTQYGSLYWTLSAIGNPYATPNQSGDGSLMTFSSYNATTGIALFTSTENTVWQNGSGATISIPTELELQFQPYNATSTGFISSGFLTPTTAGAAGITGLNASQSVLTVNGNFQVWYELIAGGSGGGQPLTTYYNNSDRSPSNGQLHTSTSGTFYWTAADETASNPESVPEPSTWCLLLGGLVLLTIPRVRAYARIS